LIFLQIYRPISEGSVATQLRCRPNGVFSNHFITNFFSTEYEGEKNFENRSTRYLAKIRKKVRGTLFGATLYIYAMAYTANKRSVISAAVDSASINIARQHLHSFPFVRPLAKLRRLHLGIEFGTASLCGQHVRAEYHERRTKTKARG